MGGALRAGTVPPAFGDATSPQACRIRLRAAKAVSGLGHRGELNAGRGGSPAYTATDPAAGRGYEGPRPPEGPCGSTQTSPKVDGPDGPSGGRKPLAGKPPDSCQADHQAAEQKGGEEERRTI